MLVIPGEFVDRVVLKAWLIWPWATPGITSSDLPIDKLVHFVLFACCGFLVTLAWTRHQRHWLMAFLLLVAYGLLTEALQHFIPGRGLSVLDVLADALGAGVGIIAALFVKKPARSTSRDEEYANR